MNIAPSPALAAREQFTIARDTLSSIVALPKSELVAPHVKDVTSGVAAFEQAVALLDAKQGAAFASALSIARYASSAFGVLQFAPQTTFQDAEMQVSLLSEVVAAAQKGIDLLS